jgi:hypothetical protein
VKVAAAARIRRTHLFRGERSVTTSRKRFVVFTTEGGVKVGVNPDHVCLVEPNEAGATIHLVSSASGASGLHRRVSESFDEVMRSLRDETRPRTVL